MLSLVPDIEQEDRERPAPVPPTAKTLSPQRLLGDITDDGQVDVRDLLYLYGYITMPDEYPVALNEYLLDINKDSQVDPVDATLLGSYLYDPNFSNTYGIGAVISMKLTAILTPDPSTIEIFNEVHVWHTFTVQTNADSLKVIVNGPGTDMVLEIAGGRIPPGRTYCGPEREDSPYRARRNNYKLHLSGCATGSTSVILKDHASGDVLKTYAVTVGSKGNEYDELDHADQQDVGSSILGGYIYWSATRWNRIFRSKLDGSEVTTILEWPRAWEIDLDLVNGKIYWVDAPDYHEGQSALIRSDLDGANSEKVVDCSEPFGMALNVDEGKVYWSDRIYDEHVELILKANLDGTQIDTLLKVDTSGSDGDANHVSITHEHFGDIALDPMGQKLYWFAVRSDYDLEAQSLSRYHLLHSMNLDGTGLKSDVYTQDYDHDSQAGLTWHIDVDSVRRKVYWAEYKSSGRDMIRRCNLDGTNAETLLEVPGEVTALHIHEATQKIYWGSRAPASIGQKRVQGLHRADLDGTNVEDIFTDMYVEPGSISIAD